MSALTYGMTMNANASTAARRATPGIIVSVSAGQMANAPPIRAIASTAASTHRWNSTHGTDYLNNAKWVKMSCV